MGKVLWSDILPGDRVELAGREWTVDKLKLKGKRVKVTVRSGSRVASSEVRANDRVKKVKRAPVKVAPLRDARNSQTRWATTEESAKAQRLGPGDVTLTKPPAKPSGDAWSEPRDKAEARVADVLGARLVGEGTDAAGYYVPMPDVATIASHLALFHPNTYDREKDEAAMLAGHAHEHAMVLDGKKRLDVVHWHTKTRPEA